MIVVLASDVSLKDKASIVRFIEQRGGRLLVSELGDVEQRDRKPVESG